MSEPDYKQYAILFVDDEVKSRKYFRRLYGGTFRILEASDGVEALAVFKEHAPEIGLVVTDQRMPNGSGVGFLAQIADDSPDVVKILSTAYSDLDAAIRAVNEGGIYRYITKPWELSELEVTLRRAMESFIAKREFGALMTAKMKVIENVVYSSRLAAFAFAPVAAGLTGVNAGQAVASFVRLGVAGAAAGGGRTALEAGVASWGTIHGEQLELAGLLENRLKGGFPGTSLAERAEVFVASLPSGDGSDLAAETGGFRLRLAGDPFPRLLGGLLGFGGDGGVDAIPVLAALMGIYETGASVRRLGGNALEIEIREGGAVNHGSPGSDVARWLIEDDSLISSALGLL